MSNDSLQVIIEIDGKFHTIECKSNDTLNDFMTKCQSTTHLATVAVKWRTNVNNMNQQSCFLSIISILETWNATLAQSGIRGNKKITLFYISCRSRIKLEIEKKKNIFEK